MNQGKDDCNGLDMYKGWVVRGHRRELLDVDQWGKNKPGESVYFGWTLLVENLHGSSLRIVQMW